MKLNQCYIEDIMMKIKELNYMLKEINHIILYLMIIMKEIYYSIK